MADKKISELTTASEIKNGDNLELSQDTGSGLVSLKATILAIANKMLNGINFTSDLQTTEKTVIGAINEVAQGGGGGSSTLDGLTDVDIDDTTLADGQALVYDGIEEKWVNGQGGGGTGGHTIIDENGNSMTARAGLQFVGGANVEDDATNNRTIVDLASAGGIDGVFVDTENIIQAETELSAQGTYTATEDCIIACKLECNNSAPLVYINDKLLYGAYSTQTGTFFYTVLLKKGQTIKFVPEGSEKKIYYTVYGIQTGTTHSKFQPVIYSTEERCIGVWKDGKPLYEKTVDFGTLPNNTTKDVAHNIANVDNIWVFDGFVYDGNGNSFQTNRPTNAFTYQWETKADRTNVSIQDFADFSAFSGFVVVRYTKTTDTAGSGSWTPQGVPAVHYSTDEHIIGTWIDGKTLYEKTIVFDNPTKTSYDTFYQYDCAYDSGNIDFARMIGLNVYDSTDSRWYEIPYQRLTADDNIQAMEMIVSHNYKCLVFFKNNQAYNLTKVVYTIQYTKSS